MKGNAVIGMSVPTEKPDNVRLTRHCKLINLTADVNGTMYEAAVNELSDNVDILITDKELHWSDEGDCSLVIFYERYEETPEKSPKAPKAMQSAIR